MAIETVDSLFVSGSGGSLGLRNRGIRFDEFRPLPRVLSFHDGIFQV